MTVSGFSRVHAILWCAGWHLVSDRWKGCIHEKLWRPPAESPHAGRLYGQGQAFRLLQESRKSGTTLEK